MLHIDSSKSRMQFSDFPMPDAYPNYCHHTQVLAYFRDYAEHFGIRRHITFNTGVDHAQRRPTALGTCGCRRAKSGNTMRCSCAMATIGIRAGRSRPFPAHFDGTAMHSHDYRDAEPFRGKNVLVLGMGNSAMDIVGRVQLRGQQGVSGRTARHAHHSQVLARTPGRPMGRPWIPWWLARIVLSPMLWLQTGQDRDRTGCPSPTTS